MSTTIIVFNLFTRLRLFYVKKNLFRHAGVNEDGTHEYGPDALALLQHLGVLVADGGQVHSRAQCHPAHVPQVAPLPRLY